jgi:predicted ATPase
MFINYIRFIEPLDKNSYLNTIPAVQFLVKNASLYFNAPITFFMGENGTGIGLISGKATFINAKNQ